MLIPAYGRLSTVLGPTPDEAGLRFAAIAVIAPTPVKWRYRPEAAGRGGEALR